jgi:DNA-binding CsgD family transcriptional regulator
MTTDLRKTGIDFVGDMPWGTHFGLFYETTQDLFDMVVPYVKAGLESNEFCIWAISEPLTEDDSRNALRQAIPDLDRYLAKGSLDIVSGHEWYLKGDEFDLKKITDGWNEKLRDALAKGYAGMRLSGNAFWLDTQHWKNFRDYEHAFDQFITGQPMNALCTYPLNHSQAADILEVTRAHQFTVARRKGVWEVIEAARAKTGNHSLTPREREVLTWVAQGKSAWEIGGILSIAKRTVDEHVQTATRKLDATNRVQAVAIAMREGLIAP